MKKLKEFFALNTWGGRFLLMGLIIFTYGVWTNKGWTKLVFVFSGLVMMLGGHIMLLENLLSPTKPSRPRVRVWKHDGITMVAAEEDYQIELLKIKRNSLACGLTKESTTRPLPQVFAFFSEDDRRPNSSVLSLKYYCSLTEKCVVEKSEMYVPQIIRCPFQPASFKTIWKMVHGLESEPPEIS